jgi:hypothetical protein
LTAVMAVPTNAWSAMAGGDWGRDRPLPSEHDPEKWQPVFGKDHASPQYLDHDPIQFDRIIV